MSRYASILAAFHSTPLAILPEKLEAIRAFLYARRDGEEVDAERVAEVVASRRPDGSQVVGRVGVIQVFGAMSQRVGMMGRSSGGCSCEDVGQQLDAMANDRAVKSIVMCFDSPGGSVSGVQELGDKILSLRAAKKVVGVADSTAASAAYWLLSQCSEANVTPGGMVGSIGVLSAHTDKSAAEERDGVKTTYITSAPYKAETLAGPLGDEARAEIQSKVDHYHGLFVKAVAKGRGVTEHRVQSDFGGGRMLTAKAAVAAGMADRVATMEQVLSRLGADSGAALSAAAVDHAILAMAISEMEDV